MGANGERAEAAKLTHRLQHGKLHLPKLILLHPGFPDDFGASFPGFLRGRWGWEGRSGLDPPRAAAGCSWVITAP